MHGSRLCWLVLLLVTFLCACRSRERPDHSRERPDHAVPRLHAVPGLPLGRPALGDLRNLNGTPAVYGSAEYQRFWREIAPLLERWARDPRLRFNPNYVAAILTKESGFYPFAVSSKSAIGCAQFTLEADEHLLRMTRAESRWSWMFREVASWPRHSAIHGPGVTPHRLRQLVRRGDIGPHNEYLLNPPLAVRGAVFWLKTLEDRWTTDELPDGYGSFARARLNQGRPLTEQQLFDLITASYNAGYAYVRELVEDHGTSWTQHTNEETAEYLDRVRHFTLLYQRAQ